MSETTNERDFRPALQRALKRKCEFDLVKRFQYRGILPGECFFELPQGRQAEILGVTRENLNMVLNGKRKSASLMEKYQTLLRAGAKPVFK